MKDNPTSPEKQTPGKNPPPGWGYYWIYWILGIFLILQMLFVGYQTPRETTWSEFEKMVLAGDVAKLEVINKERVEITLNPEKINPDKYREWKKGQTGPHYYFTIGSVEVFESKLSKIKAAHPDVALPPVKYLTRVNWFQTLLSWLFPILIIVLVWVYIFSRLGGKGGIPGTNPFDFGKSKATLFDSKNKTKVTFEDVAGLDEAKVEVREIVEFLKNPEIYTRLGAKIPKGVILIGPPGTGKTLLAKAVAGEAEVPFFNISGSEFVEMFVGVGASRVRDLFKKAKERAPSIIFIDEIDAIGRMRGSTFSLRSNDERESTLNQLLTEMDGFGANTGVIVMAATNRADILDKALLRPGRFDRHIYLELPNLHERIAIFNVHLKPLRLADGINVELLAAQTPGFSGADIANMCNEAALIAARKGKDKVEMTDFSDATDRIVAGLEKKSKILSPKEKKIIAYHEAGHATASWYLEHADELVKVSIVPRGRSLGAAWYLPEEHQIITKAQFLDKICAALGGRVAEEIVFGEISSGALDDLEKVTKQAYSMVAFYGLDEKLGPVSFYDSTGKYDQSLQKPYSEATAKLIDEEVRNLVSFAFDRTRKILTEHLDELEAVAQSLLKNEVIFKKDLEVIFQKRHNDPNPADPMPEHLKNKRLTP